MRLSGIRLEDRKRRVLLLFVVIIDIICIFLGAFFPSFMEDVSDGDELLRNSKHAQNNCSHTFIFKFFALPSTSLEFTYLILTSLPALLLFPSSLLYSNTNCKSLTLISFMDTVIAKFAMQQLCQCHNTLQTHQELWRSGC